MRAPLYAFGFALAVASPALAMEPMTFHLVRGEADGARVDDEEIVTWEGDAWIGGDVNKLWVKTEAESESGTVEHAEVQALWSRAVADFWDLQLGVRVDLEPETTAHLAFGVQGLAPYQFETEATAFVSEDGDVSARLHQSLDLHISQRLIAEPYIEVNVYAQDIAERDIGAGFADGEIGLQVRYEITRKFAPYVDLVHERALGETASRVRASGQDVERSALRAGVRFWF
ncbi:MAG: copper resistance protein B [Hyphomonadaceae bacterium]|nr:copper resistance protein B [Hyphomonadaceae bacterium]